jgi:hypothetical protein
MKYLKKYKLFESNSNKEVLDDVEEIFREISDVGFKVEYNRGGVDELLKVYIEKFAVYGFSQEERECKYYPTQEFVNAFLHLTSYVNESNLDHRIEIIDDSKVVDVISTESEIEDMINWKEPIDYIKVIISYKEDNISESIKPEYDDEWKKPGNPIREMLEVELREILLEVIDMGYRPQLSGFTKGFSKSGPYVWICNRRLSHDDFWNEITDTVERVKDYLSEKGFNVYQDIINEGSRTEQVYIYFNIGN